MIANLFDPNTSKYYQWVYNNLQFTQPLGFFLFILITFGLTILMGIQQSRIDKISEDFAKIVLLFLALDPENKQKIIYWM